MAKSPKPHICTTKMLYFEPKWPKLPVPAGPFQNRSKKGSKKGGQKKTTPQSVHLPPLKKSNWLFWVFRQKWTKNDQTPWNKSICSRLFRIFPNIVWQFPDLLFCLRWPRFRVCVKMLSMSASASDENLQHYHFTRPVLLVKTSKNLEKRQKCCENFAKIFAKACF